MNYDRFIVLSAIAFDWKGCEIGRAKPPQAPAEGTERGKERHLNL